MPWFKVDDSFWGNPKRVGCSPSAIGLWVVSGSWSAQQLTDGFVPDHVLGLLGGSQKLAKQLSISGLWDRAEGGWKFHDWHDYQPTRAKVEADRAEARDRMARARSRRSSSEVRPNNERSSEDVRLTPTRPDPSHTELPNGSSQESGSRKRGTRLPAEWMPEESTKEWARREHPNVNLTAAHEKFTNYWLALAGQKGVKLDWDRTWRNWIIRESESARPSNGRSASGLTNREREIAQAELLKENPNQEILRHAGLATPTHLRAIDGGNR